MAKFTKGPWHVEISRHDHYPYICDKSHNQVAFALTTDIDYDYTDESIANSRLIAKAPEMYEIFTGLAGVLAVHIYTQDIAVKIANLLNEIDVSPEGDNVRNDET